MKAIVCTKYGPPEVREALGHASVGFIMDIYSHIIKGMQQDAMALLNEMLPAGINSTQNKCNANFTPTSQLQPFLCSSKLK